MASMDEVELMDVDEDMLDLSSDRDASAASVLENARDRRETVSNMLKSLNADDSETRDALLVYGVDGLFSTFDVEALVEPVNVRVQFHDSNRWCVVYFSTDDDAVRTLMEQTQPLVIVPDNASTNIAVPTYVRQMKQHELPTGIEEVGPWRIFKQQLGTVLASIKCKLLLTRFATSAECKIVKDNQDVLTIKNDSAPPVVQPQPSSSSKSSSSSVKPPPTKVVSNTVRSRVGVVPKLVYGGARTESRIERELARAGQPPLNPSRQQLKDAVLLADKSLRSSTKQRSSRIKTDELVKRSDAESGILAGNLKTEIRNQRLSSARTGTTRLKPELRHKSPPPRISESDRKSRIAARIKPAAHPAGHVKNRLSLSAVRTRRHRSVDADPETTGISISLPSEGGNEEAVRRVAGFEDVLVVEDDEFRPARARERVAFDDGATTMRTAEDANQITSGVAGSAVAASLAGTSDLRQQIEFQRYARQRLTAAEVKRQQEISEQQQHYQEMARAYEKRQSTASYDNDLF